MKASNRGNVIFKIVCISLYLPFHPLQSKKKCKSMFHISVFVNSRDKPRAHESLQYAVPTWNNQIHSSLEKKKNKTLWLQEVLSSQQNRVEITESSQIPLASIQSPWLSTFPPEWCICYSWWICIDTSSSSKVHSLH